MKCDKRKPNPFRKVWLNYEWIFKTTVRAVELFIRLFVENQ